MGAQHRTAGALAPLRHVGVGSSISTRPAAATTAAPGSDWPSSGRSSSPAATGYRRGGPVAIPRHSASPATPASRCTSPRPARRGGAGPTRTPMGCCATTFPRAPTFGCTPGATWTPSPSRQRPSSTDPRGSHRFQSGCPDHQHERPDRPVLQVAGRANTPADGKPCWAAAVATAWPCHGTLAMASGSYRSTGEIQHEV
jgi:hypothetical protein